MSVIKILTGNIFTSTCQTLVNTVNCVGVMGAGMALECRLRWPRMFERYVQLCADGSLQVGRLWLYRGEDRWVLNFPTKQHWRHPSRASYLREGLERFLDTYEERGIESVAFPLLGAQHGGLDRQHVLDVMTRHLEQCRIPVEIHHYDPKAPDDLYGRFRQRLLESDEQGIKDATGLDSRRIGLLRAAVASPHIHQLNQLAATPGIGDKTLERAFVLARADTMPVQQGLW
ncbi:macro domain-containing protein [Denitratimonas sp. CY0512]|uniref:macro domain-containing protein n=1 Tax=Denitratimonas sp. CY0512 TaxID=3131940 RepID=UPI0030B7CA02